jgi:hypothetical protein
MFIEYRDRQLGVAPVVGDKVEVLAALPIGCDLQLDYVEQRLASNKRFRKGFVSILT